MRRKYAASMVDVAQLVELRIVDPVVVGSNPIVHPNSPWGMKIGALNPDQTIPATARRWHSAAGHYSIESQRDFRKASMFSAICRALS